MPSDPAVRAPDELTEAERAGATTYERHAEVQSTLPAAVRATEETADDSFLENVATFLESHSTRADADRLRKVTLHRNRTTSGYVERVAEAIYDALRENDPEGKGRPWVPGGNSLKQDEARRCARAALSSESPRPPEEETPTPLPCPFCGSDGAEETIVDANEGVAYTPWYRAGCHKCDFWLPGARDADEAVAAWNRRATPNAPRGKRSLSTRVYCDGALSKATLKSKLDEGFVLTDVIRNGCMGGDVAYFRQGTAEEIEDCRSRMTASETLETRNSK